MVDESLRVFARAYLCGRESRPEAVKRKLASTNPGFLVQTARASAVKNEFLAEMLAAQTLRAQSSGSLLAKKPEIDFLLRLSGTTQISRALKDQGAREGAPFVVVAAGHEDVREPPELAGRELPKKNLTAAELSRVERAALLNARRY